MAAAAALLWGAPLAARAQQVEVIAVRPPQQATLLVRGGTVTLKVADFNAARQSVLSIAQSKSAVLLDARTLVTEKGRKHGWLRLRLDADRLDQLLPAVKQTGMLYAENLRTSDRASENSNLAQRAQRLREHQARLEKLLGGERRLRGSDILYVQERLFRAGVDEEMLKQKRVDLEKQSRNSTIIVELFEPTPTGAIALARIDIAGGWARGRARADWLLGRLMQRGVTAGAYALVFAPFWVPAFFITLLAGRLLWRHGRRLAGTLAPVYGAFKKGRAAARLAAPPSTPAG